LYFLKKYILNSTKNYYYIIFKSDLTIASPPIVSRGSKKLNILRSKSLKNTPKPSSQELVTQNGTPVPHEEVWFKSFSNSSSATPRNFDFGFNFGDKVEALESAELRSAFDDSDENISISCKYHHHHSGDVPKRNDPAATSASARITLLSDLAERNFNEAHE